MFQKGSKQNYIDYKEKLMLEIIIIIFILTTTFYAFF